MADSKHPIVTADSWRDSEAVQAKLKLTPQPAIVIIGGKMYIFTNATVEREVHIVGGVLQYINLNVNGVSDSKGGIGREVDIGTEKMMEILEEYNTYKDKEPDGDY